jgi:predicted HicB family RNase H-like nuclease
MLISQLINTLSVIMEEYGNINVELYYDSRESENILPDKNICIDNINVIKMKPDEKGVYLSNEFIEYYEYKGCNCTVKYNPETEEYEGKVIPYEQIEGFNTNFTVKNKYQVEEVFHYAVDEYLDFLGNAQVKRTLEKVKDIVGDDKEDLDYGELKASDEYPPSDDDKDYN